MIREDIEAAIAETIAALRDAVRQSYSEMADTYSCVLGRLHALLRDL